MMKPIARVDLLVAALAVSVFAGGVALGQQQGGSRAGNGQQIDKAMKTAFDRYKGLKEGANADYIPALAKVDSNLFGIAVVTVDGQVHSIGDVKSEVSIQSISKVFTLARVLQDSGAEQIQNTIG